MRQLDVVTSIFVVVGGALMSGYVVGNRARQKGRRVWVPAIIACGVMLLVLTGVHFAMTILFGEE